MSLVDDATFINFFFSLTCSAQFIIYPRQAASASKLLKSYGTERVSYVP